MTRKEIELTTGETGELVIDVPEDVEFDVDASDDEIVVQWWDESDHQEDDEDDWIEDDRGNKRPRRSESADFGGGESTGVQDL